MISSAYSAFQRGSSLFSCLLGKLGEMSRGICPYGTSIARIDYIEGMFRLEELDVDMD